MLPVSWQSRFPEFYDVWIVAAEPSDLFGLFERLEVGRKGHIERLVPSIFELLDSPDGDPAMVFPRIADSVLLGWEVPCFKDSGGILSLSKLVNGNRLELLFHSVSNPVAAEPMKLVTVNWGDRARHKICPATWTEAQPILEGLDLGRLAELPLPDTERIEVEQSNVDLGVRSVIVLREEIRTNYRTRFLVSGFRADK